MQSVPISFLKCKAVEVGYYMLASKPDELDEDTEFTRIFYFDDQVPKDKWRHTDLRNFSVADLCVVKKAMGGQRRYATLSKDGDVFYAWPGGQLLEKIADAGLKKNAPIYGQMNSIREIDGVLYACGAGGQIYMRNIDGWSDIAGVLRKPTPTISANLALNSIELADNINDIDGYSGDDLYVCGGKGLYYYNGIHWEECQASADEIIINVLCTGENVVWACGFNGAILKGNASTGFKDVSHYDDNMIFSKMVIFEGRVYLASNEGLYSFSLEKEKTKLEKIEGIDDCEDLSVVDNFMLCVGSKKIKILNGGSWSELLHPDKLV